MRTLLVIMAVSLGFAALIAHPALAADLSNAFGSTCDGTGIWHFVNNQTGGASTGTITAQYSCGTFSANPSKVNQSNIQFLIQTEGDCTLQDASTNLPGRLVLSDFTCTPVKCTINPKTGKCE